MQLNYSKSIKTNF